MKTLFITLCCVMLLSGAAFARDTYVRGQAPRDSTSVEPPRRTNPHYTRNDNSPTKGNTNPNTGAQERKSPDPYAPQYGKQYNRPAYRY